MILNLIDRYIIKQFVMTLLFAILALCVIFLVVNLMESLDSFLDQNVSAGTILKYYLYFFPEILKLLTPVATLLATLFTIGKLSTQNETTAIKSGGMSLYRMMMPLVILSLGLSFFQLYFNGWLVPEANSRKIAIEEKYLNKKKNGEALYNLYFRDTPLRNVIMQSYEAETKQAIRVAIEDFSSEKSPRLLSRTESEKMVWNDKSNHWLMIHGIKREFSGNKVISTGFDTLETKIVISHNQIIQLKRSEDEMTFDELKSNIALLSRGGKDVRKQLIDYYGDYAFPFANFIVVLFGVPFASVRKKGGIAIQIGAAMVIAFTYMIFTEFSKTIAYSADLDPILSGWVANIIFFTAGLVVLIRTKT